MKLLATIEAEHLNPQEYEYLKMVLEKALNRNGVKVEIYGEADDV